MHLYLSMCLRVFLIIKKNIKVVGKELMNSHKTKGRVAVDRAYSTGDLVVLAVTFLTFFLMTSAYFVLSYIIENASMGNFASIEWTTGLVATLFGSLMLFFLILAFGMFIVRMQRQTMLGNSLQVEYSDYAWLRDWTNIVAADLEMPRVEVFITQDPVINAYAFGFIKPYTIVLNSGSIRYLTRDELKVVVVHEMGHIKYGHTAASMYLLPFLSLPIINVIGIWVSGFWRRRTEFTCDRLALMYLEDSELVKASLIKVDVGPDVAKSMNEIARQWLHYNAERPMNRLAQTLSSHPFLVRRLSHVDRWKHYVEPAVDYANYHSGGQV
ncbi:M48 family peptidase [Candidatus Saccharibacteria bacterium]|nr:M48 family peptidase [Candidatus Saccharibacteria bacterium]